MFGRDKKKQTELLKTRVFISYSRKDKQFVEQLVPALEAENIEVFIDNSEHRRKDEQDSKSIAIFEDWWKRLEEMIIKSDTVIFVISADSMASEVCQDEVNFAKSHNKRFAPIVWRDPGTIEVPQALSEINYLFFNEGTDFELQIKELITALKTNVEWIRKHTDYTEKALAWKNTTGRNAHKLLQGEDIELAEQWQANILTEAISPTKLQFEFITASRKEKIKRQRRLLMTSIIGTLVGISLMSIAIWQWDLSRRNAERATFEAKSKLLSQSKSLTQKAQELLKDKEAGHLPALLALEALPYIESINEAQKNRPFWPLAKETLMIAENNIGSLNKKRKRKKRNIISFPEIDGVSKIISLKDSNRILVARGSQIILYDVSRDKIINRIKPTNKKNAVRTFQITHDQRSLIFVKKNTTIKNNNTIFIRNFLSGKETKIGFVQDFTGGLAASSDGKTIASTSADGSIYIWNILKRKLSKKLLASGTQFYWPTRAKSYPTVVTFSPNNKKLVSGYKDGTVILWDLISGKELRIFKRHNQDVSAMVFSPDSRKLITASYDKSIRVWDTFNGRELQQFLGHEAFVNSIAISPSGEHIVSASNDKTVRVWDINTGKQIKRFMGHRSYVYSVDISADGKTIYSGSWDGTVRLWNLPDTTLKVLQGHNKGVNEIKLSTNEDFLLSASSDKTIRQWDIKSFRQLRKFTAHTENISNISIAPNSLYFASSADDFTLKLWNKKRKRREFIRTFEGHGNVISDLVFSKDSRYLIGSTYMDGRAFQWNIKTGKIVRTVKHTGLLTLAISSNGELLATAGEDMKIRLWKLKTGKLIKTFTGHKRGVDTIQFSPNDEFLISGSKDKTLRLWRISDGNLVNIFRGHKGSITDVAFLNEGKLIVSGSYDKTLRVWDRLTKTTIMIFTGHEEEVTSIAIAKKLPYLFSSSFDGKIKVWDKPKILDPLLRIKKKLPVCLSEKERRKFFLHPAPPRWCITGPGLEREKNSAKWQPKYPYHTKAWKDWLIAKDAGKSIDIPKQ